MMNLITKLCKIVIAVSVLLLIMAYLGSDGEKGEFKNNVTTPTGEEFGIDPYGVAASQAIAQCELQFEAKYPTQVMDMNSLSVLFKTNANGRIEYVYGNMYAKNVYTGEKEGNVAVNCKVVATVKATATSL